MDERDLDVASLRRLRLAANQLPDVMREEMEHMDYFDDEADGDDADDDGVAADDEAEKKSMSTPAGRTDSAGWRRTALLPVPTQPVFRFVEERRFPFFLDSDLSLELELCRQLLAPGPEYERLGIHPQLLQAALGSFSAMTALREFLASRPSGLACLLFWLDAESCCRRPGPDLGARIRDIHERYFRAGAPLLVAEGPLAASASTGAASPLDHIAQLQLQLLSKLRAYWVPRFLMHREAMLIDETEPAQASAATQPAAASPSPLPSPSPSPLPSPSPSPSSSSAHLQPHPSTLRKGAARRPPSASCLSRPGRPGRPLSAAAPKAEADLPLAQPPSLLPAPAGRAHRSLVDGMVPGAEHLSAADYLPDLQASPLARLILQAAEKAEATLGTDMASHCAAMEMRQAGPASWALLPPPLDPGRGSSRDARHSLFATPSGRRSRRSPVKRSKSFFLPPLAERRSSVQAIGRHHAASSSSLAPTAGGPSASPSPSPSLSPSPAASPSPHRSPRPSVNPRYHRRGWTTPQPRALSSTPSSASAHATPRSSSVDLISGAAASATAAAEAAPSSYLNLARTVSSSSLLGSLPDTLPNQDALVAMAQT